jgi:hypothetical protein
MVHQCQEHDPKLTPFSHTLRLMRELGVHFAQGTSVCCPAALETL